MQGKHQLKIHAKSGVGDVVITVRDKRIRAECKGGPLIKKPESREYAILRGALGQVLTIEHVVENDYLVVAVPDTRQFQRLAEKWQIAPLITRSGIHIVLVGQDGTVEGLGL